MHKGKVFWRSGLLWLFPGLLQLCLPGLLQQRQKNKEKAKSLAEQNTKSSLPSWSLPAHEGELKGMERMKTDYLDHPAPLGSP